MAALPGQQLAEGLEDLEAEQRRRAAREAAEARHRQKAARRPSGWVGADGWIGSVAPSHPPCCPIPFSGAKNSPKGISGHPLITASHTIVCDIHLSTYVFHICFSQTPTFQMFEFPTGIRSWGLPLISLSKYFFAIRYTPSCRCRMFSKDTSAPENGSLGPLSEPSGHITRGQLLFFRGDFFHFPFIL